MAQEVKGGVEDSGAAVQSVCHAVSSGIAALFFPWVPFFAAAFFWNAGSRQEEHLGEMG